MSTSNKLTYLNGTKQELKQKINNLGGSIDDNTTFRQYANQLQNVYDNLPKTEYQEGTEINLGVTIKGKLDYENGVVGIGQTSQESTQGYNLYYMDYSEYTQTWNGVTITSKKTGYSITGKATSTAGYALVNRTITLPAGDYTLAIKKPSQLNIQLSNTSYQKKAEVPIGQTKGTFTLTEETRLALVLIVVNGQTYNEENEIMIYSGTADKPFEKYTGGQASPNPSYPQEIEYVRGRNLYNKDKTPENYYIDGSGEKVYVSNNDFINQEYYLSNTSIAISFSSRSTTSAYVRACEYNGDTFIKRTLVSATNTIIALNSNTNRVIFSTDNSSTTYFSNLQIEKGTQVTPYLPYNTIEEVVSGKNIYKAQLYTDNTKILALGCSVSINGDEFELTANRADIYAGELTVSGSNYNASRGFKIYRNGHSKISFRMTNTNFRKNIFTAYDKNNVSLGWTGINNDTGTYTFPDDCEYATFRFGIGTAEAGTIYKTKIVMAYGDEIPDYEPYITPTSYQLSLGDKKLYDECYIVGSPDNWKFVEYYEKYTMTGEETINMQNQNTRFGFDLATASTDTTKAGQVLAKSNYFKGISFNDRNNSINSVYQICNGSSRSIQFNTGTMFEDKTAFTNWVIANHPHIVYLRETPIETPITDETLILQLNAWYNAHSNNGTTIITSNGNLPMIIKCRALKGE